MAEQNSFDVVSKVDIQEVKNAVDQSLKEVSQRFDFKGTKTELTLKEKEGELVVVSDDEYKLKSVVDILKTKLIKYHDVGAVEDEGQKEGEAAEVHVSLRVELACLDLCTGTASKRFRSSNRC